MLTKLEFIEYAKKNITYNGERLEYDNNTDSLNVGNYSLPINDLYENYNNAIGQNFECIYDNDAFCTSILKCKCCGTVIIYRYDEEYEKNFCCPICTNYKTNFKYFTHEEIEKDFSLQQQIKIYEEMTKSAIEREERIEKRNGLRDNQLLKKKINLGKNIYDIIFEIDSITNKNKLKGLTLKIEKYKKIKKI